VRAKGIVRLAAGGGCWEVQTVGTAIRVRAAPPGASTTGARLVLIGTGLDESSLVGALEECVARADGSALAEHAALALTRYRIDLADHDDVSTPARP
jgi:hypothetical protein